MWKGRILGLYVDQNIKRYNHIDKLKKLSFEFSLVGVQNFLSFNAKILYNAHIFPIMDYGIPTWDQRVKEILKKLTSEENCQTNS